MLFYPTSETAIDPNTAQAMLFDSLDAPQAGAVGDRLIAAGILGNSNISSTIQNMPTTNDIHQHHGGHQTVQTLPCFNDLIAVLIECFALIAIGYFSGRFKLISPDAKDIGAYLTTFALPMIIFLNVAQMEIQTINLSFLACMLTSKLVLFVLVTAITLAISYPANFSYAGALSILATQSNDFALGYPLFKSLYGESKPEMLSYLNLMGPIQLLIINPLGIVMLEFEKSRATRTMRRRANSIAARKRCLHCMKNLQHTGLPPSPPEQSHGQASQHLPSQPIAVVSPLGHSYEVTQGVDAPQSQLIRRLNSPIMRLSADSNQSSDLNQARDRNIKSLALVMPARMMPERDGTSDETDSTDDLITDCSQRKANNNNNNSQATPPILFHPVELSSSTADSVDFEHTPPAAAAQRIESSVVANGTTLMTKPQFSKTSPVDHHRELAGQQRLASPKQLESSVVVPSQLTTVDTTPTRCSCWNNNGQLSIEKEPVIDLGFVKALLTNPLIIASVVALAVNLIHGPELPKFVTKVSNTIAASFAAPALFVVGLSMYGKFKLILKNPNDLLLSSVLVLTKVFILPNLMRTIILMVLPHYTDAEEIPYLADFAYLYGLLPTAPGACIIAKQYEVLTNVVSICMLLSTFISAPMMLGTSAIISQVSATAPETTLNIIAQTLRISSSITLTLSLLTLYMLWKSNRRIMSALDRIMRNVAELKASHVFTFLLALTQLLIGIGGFLWFFVDTSKQNQQSFTDQMARDGSLLTASGETAHGWPRDDIDDLLAEEERMHTIEPRAFMIAPNTQAIGFGALCTIKYVLASGGILMARFIILCIVVTNFAKHFRGHQLAVQVSSLMLKVYPLFGIGVILSLVIESRHLSCLPSESSLPTWSFSLYLRMTFNALLLVLAVPLFTATFRLSNKAAWLETQNMHEATSESSPAGLLEKRRFVTSNVSLSSDTSSAITTSTSLEATLNGGGGGGCGGVGGGTNAPQRGLAASAQQPNAAMSHDKPQSRQQQRSTVLLIDYDTSNSQQQHPVASGGCQLSPPMLSCEDKISLSASAEDVARRQQKKQGKKKVITQCDINNNNNCNELFSNSSAVRKQQRQTGQADSNQMTEVLSMNNDNLIAPPSPSRNNIPTIQQETETITTTTMTRQAEATSIATGINTDDHNWPPVTEFNKYSILIVFMLFQTLVSLTSIIQLLNQDKPSGGTFIMGEITNVAIDFGQGLVTFLVIGSQSYLKDLISSFGSTSSSSIARRTRQQQPTDSQA